MKSITLAGIVLIVPRTVALAYRGITYTRREKLVDIGPIKTIAYTPMINPLPP